jgi:hypothetical protein
VDWRPFDSWLAQFRPIILDVLIALAYLTIPVTLIPTARTSNFEMNMHGM